jgi:hypothetical protein
MRSGWLTGVVPVKALALSFKQDAEHFLPRPAAARQHATEQPAGNALRLVGDEAVSRADEICRGLERSSALAGIVILWSPMTTIPQETLRGLLRPSCGCRC